MFHVSLFTEFLITFLIIFLPVKYMQPQKTTVKRSISSKFMDCFLTVSYMKRSYCHRTLYPLCVISCAL